MSGPQPSGRALSRARGDGRPAAPVRLVHLGLGNFFRAHQAWYTDRAPDAADWGIAAFTGRSGALADSLAAQDGLYTLITRAAEGDHFEVVSSLTTYPSRDRPRRLVWLPRLPGRAWGDAHGYRGRVRPRRRRRPGPGPPRDPRRRRGPAQRPRRARAHRTRAAGRRLRGPPPRRRRPARPRLLRQPARQRRGAGPGRRRPGRDGRPRPRRVGGGVGLVRHHDGRPDHAPDHARGPAGGGRRHRAARTAARSPPSRSASGCSAAPSRAAGPDWDGAGATITDNIEPYEHRKLWLLNGAHSMLAYAGSARGHETVAEAVADDTCRDWMQQWWEEASRHLDLPTADIQAYRDALLERFANPRMHHRLAQIAADGSQKLPVRILPVLRRERSAGRMPEGAARALAAWVMHLRGAGAPVDDVRAEPDGRARRRSAARRRSGTCSTRWTRPSARTPSWSRPCSPAPGSLPPSRPDGSRPDRGREADVRSLRGSHRQGGGRLRRREREKDGPDRS